MRKAEERGDSGLKIIYPVDYLHLPGAGILTVWNFCVQIKSFCEISFFVLLDNVCNIIGQGREVDELVQS